MTADDAATILVVEDDDATRTFLADNLTADGFELLVADCARDGLRLMETKFPDLALVDVGLPDASGLRAAAPRAPGRRRRQPHRPADADRPDLRPRLGDRPGARLRARLRRLRVQAVLLSGAARPRVERLLRRVNGRRALGRLRVGDLEVDPPSREVRLRGARIDLSQKEFALLRTLASDPARVFTKDELLRSIWGFRTRGTTRTLDSHACRLRQKLAASGDRFVVNVWGVGYRLVDAPGEAAA